MKKPNGKYAEIVVHEMGDDGVHKRVFWSHIQAMCFIHENAPITIAGFYERKPTRFTKEKYPELYE